MAWYNFKKSEEKKDDQYQSFSTPFGKVGKGNLSLPYLNEQYKGAGGYVQFGADNLYPQLLNQMYYASPLHSSICNFIVKATTGGGYSFNRELDTQTKVDIYSFESRLRLDRSLFAIGIDRVLHGRVYFIYNKKTKKFTRVSPEKVRMDSEKCMYFVCDDWSRQINVRTYEPYSPTCKHVESIYCWEDFSIGQDVYTLPSYSSAMNWIYLDAEMSYLHKSNIQNSIFPSFALMFPKKFTTTEEMNIVTKAIEKAKGAGEAGKVVVFSANGKDQLPDLVPIPTQQNDKLFIETDEQINLKICQAHTIDPMLMGVRVSGKLGGGSDIKQSYIIFEKNTVMPLRKDIEEIVNGMLHILQLPTVFELNDFQIINETIVEK